MLSCVARRYQLQPVAGTDPKANRRASLRSGDSAARLAGLVAAFGAGLGTGVAAGAFKY